MQQHISDPNLEKILEQLKPFGFTFQGYDENRRPLVVAPNGQIVEINVAIKFANEQIAKAKADSESGSSGSPEYMPEAPQMPNTPKNLETAMETSVEEEQQVEKVDEEKPQSTATPNSDFIIEQKAPQFDPAKVEKIKPYGAGFDPKTFDMGNKASVTNFVEKNIKKNTSNSNKWLAVMFKKFMDENKV